ncbi:PEP/pyruvate-binding domain-containing protein [uncultured Desulfuromonas sp.]|uniref:PEP/pyruvate-binding domain-containing protein n=1 Tax=uncultured Desulfuromonas sp. TaxID=181013 RepID=UPI00260B29C1|nr:PEP/pyruvate-binding domain-containing protein [uncultured Desulfuromonas sp.]
MPGTVNWALSLDQIAPRQRPLVGGKAWALSLLLKSGHSVPPALCLTIGLYRRYLRQTGLGDRIGMELGRKEMSEMRWEELWDASLRIRALFLTTPLPKELGKQAAAALAPFAGKAAVVRSSAPGEDAPGASFAGLHDSFVNLRGTEEILGGVRKVWASLWSDRALLYRQELGLAVERSSMAVLVQELAEGERSGVAFSRAPDGGERAVVEAVWGLNQGLVDGSVEPDHWEVEHGETIVARRAPSREAALRPGPGGVRSEPLPPAQSSMAPLADGEVLRVAAAARDLEALSGRPQDVEWTLRGEELILLQARPITTAAGDDSRRWYLSLHRSVENLRRLRRSIEEELLPRMETEAAALAVIDPAGLPDRELAAEIGRRRQIVAGWEETYRDKCIPMAHGVRLFGTFFNDALHPEDPFDFLALLGGTGMRAVDRNRGLEQMAAALRHRPEWAEHLRRTPEQPWPGPLEEQLERLLAEFFGLLPGATEAVALRLRLAPLILELAPAAGGDSAAEKTSPERLRRAFLEKFEGEQRTMAEEVLDLARASYRLRDDDNISLGKIHTQLAAAEDEARRRLAAKPVPALEGLFPAEEGGPGPAPREAPRLGQVQARQLQGQPAGPGVATGSARVIDEAAGMGTFRSGEILICDAIDPTMTFLAPLAAGIVERRGGMLIHGAIIAREYGLPCVTGVPEATLRIRTGDRVTVDGYLGIVTISRLP